MLEQHESHIVSTYTTALQHLAEIRQVVTTGETPAGGRPRADASLPGRSPSASGYWRAPMPWPLGWKR